MTTRLKIDFVSDVSCPWCAVGLSSLESALTRLRDQVDVELHFQPFELNPDMPPEGKDIVEYMTQKYGYTPQRIKSNAETIRVRGEQVGFTFHMDKRTRSYNTFDAHRLLHWAETQGHQRALKHALFKAYFTDGEDPSSHAVLIRVAGQAGLDVERAKEILSSDTYASEVREREQFYLDQGIHSVPAVIVNDRHLIQGGQPPEVFEQALLQIVTETV
ncbi:MAG: DsbA family oxidoreductase [Burkholderiaceae bacterium]